MISTLSPSCQGERACAKPLLLGECLERWRHETHAGTLDTGRYRCRYVSWGRGPALVLIPGLAMEALGFALLMARLQSQFRCISYDLPDGADDGARLMTYTHAHLVSDLFALLDHLGIGRCFLLGSSFGATIALAALHRQPSRFAQVILQGGFARRPLARAEVLASCFARFLPGQVGDWPCAKPIVEHIQREVSLVRDPDVAEFFVAQHLRMPLRALAARALILHRLDLRPLLPAIQQPVYLVCGDRDPLVGKACEAELQQGLPQVARAEIDNCGHMPQLTHPDVLAEVVRLFFKPLAA